MTIPFVDLRAQHEEVRAEIEIAISDIIDKSCFIFGKYVTGFEQKFAEYLGVEEAIGVANGTDALWLSMTALGVGQGDTVLTVPNTFIATTEAITRSGAYPLFIDIDLNTCNIDLNALETFLNESCYLEDDGKVIHKESGKRIAAIMPVHLYGLPVDMILLMEIANRFNLPVIEDSCQAHGARYKYNERWKRAGTFGIAAGFSFYPGKNLGAMGDGGAVVTNDRELATKIRWLRDHGSSEKYVHNTPFGWNSRLDAIQAAVLAIKLDKLDEWNDRRRHAAGHYQEVLSDLPFILPTTPNYAEHVYHLYVVHSEDREILREGLLERGIGVGLHYPIPLHLQTAYDYLGIQEGRYPNTEKSARTLLSLPMHPALNLDQVEQVGEACNEILRK